jgi:hypothetical protein
LGHQPRYGWIGGRRLPIYLPFYAYPYTYPLAYYDDSYGQMYQPPVQTVVGDEAPPPVVDPPAAPYDDSRASAPAPQAPEAPQIPTVLVFRDGHRMEVRNYAIVGQTLFNLSGSGPRRIALTDLDVDATIEANGDRGVTFSLPRQG